jgi:hypothetical protein
VETIRFRGAAGFLICLVAGDLGKGERGKGKAEKGKGGDRRRGQGKLERVKQKRALVFHFSRNREIRPVFTFFTS